MELLNDLLDVPLILFLFLLQGSLFLCKESDPEGGESWICRQIHHCTREKETLGPTRDGSTGRAGQREDPVLSRCLREEKHRHPHYRAVSFHQIPHPSAKANVFQSLKMLPPLQICIIFLKKSKASWWSKALLLMPPARPWGVGIKQLFLWLITLIGWGGASLFHCSFLMHLPPLPST